MGQKSKLLILSECVNRTEKIGGTWTNTNSCRENEALSDICTWNILRHNWFKLMFTYSMTESSQWNYCYANRPLRKHDVIKVCGIEYLTTELELLLPTFKSWTVHKIIEYLTLGQLSSLWNIYPTTTAYFFDPLCTAERDVPTRPKSSTPSAAKMKNRRKNSRPRLLTSGRACTTVSSSVRTDCAIFSSFRTKCSQYKKVNVAILDCWA